MNKKPRFIAFITAVFLCLALSFPLQIMHIYSLGLSEFVMIFSKLTAMNYMLMAFFIVCAYYSYKINKHIFIILPFLIFFVFLNNFIVAQYGDNYTHTQTLLSSVAFLLLCLSFYQVDIYQVYHNEKFRWWMVPTRYKKSIPVKIKVNDDIFISNTFDISKTGMFIEEDKNSRLLNIEQNTHISITLLKNIPIEITATVVRASLAKGKYPAGIGIKIENIIRPKDTTIVPA